MLGSKGGTGVEHASDHVFHLVDLLTDVWVGKRMAGGDRMAVGGG